MADEKPAEETAPDPRSEAKGVIKEALDEWLELNKPASKKTHPDVPSWWASIWGT